MADNRLNKIGLQYFWNRIKTIFATKTELSTLSGRVDDIVAEGGEPNVVETVKVNGAALTPDINKAVDISVPTKTSDLTNDGDGTSVFATETYVDTNGGKIDKIKVNDTEQAIANKTVNLTIPDVEGQSNGIRVADPSGANASILNATDGVNISYTNGSNVFSKIVADKDYVDNAFRTEAQVQEAIDAALDEITGIDFEVVTSLPATGKKGVIYLLSNSGGGHNSYDEYIWVDSGSGTSGRYEKIGTTDVDLSDYWSKSELVAITTAEIDAIVDGTGA